MGSAAVSRINYVGPRWILNEGGSTRLVRRHRAGRTARPGRLRHCPDWLDWQPTGSLIPVQDGLQITLSGRYPESRYMSFAVYDENGTSFTANGVSSSLTDYQIMPDPGSVNPWQQVARPGGAFTVTLQGDVTPNLANALPIAPNASSAGTTDVL